ncbi:hypothetical protein BCR35DRAFT_308469 [Leucosporidium creatinivorum]|uniref:Uncharacterized protein n=1 Tax=Leucosporidium creatinivorum TaxID=106004 RepID=A0A1Y2E5H9_9BASI|nr:hypothetical protein BCR35DRAFT_308469 [Leucosporidium creatinivorum]
MECRVRLRRPRSLLVLLLPKLSGRRRLNKLLMRSRGGARRCSVARRRGWSCRPPSVCPSFLTSSLPTSPFPTSYLLPPTSHLPVTLLDPIDYLFPPPSRAGAFLRLALRSIPSPAPHRPTTFLSTASLARSSPPSNLFSTASPLPLLGRRRKGSREGGLTAC